VPSIPNPSASAPEAAIPPLANDWRGHFPVTSVALLSLLHRATADQLEFSRVERILWIACEFWAAVNARELNAHLDTEVGDPLRDARFAFSAIGATVVVETLRQAAAGTAGAKSSGTRCERISDIEDRLLRLPQAVDMLIARFAWRYLSEEPKGIEPAAGVLESRKTRRDYRRLLT
jgi:hypothetical protein